MIHYHTPSYFLRKLTFSEATTRLDAIFLLEVLFIYPAGLTSYEFSNPKR